MTRRHLVVALLACLAMGAAIAGRLLACAGCDYAILGVPLFAAGSAVYLGLGLAALFGARLRIIGWIALPAVAFQAGLARFLLQVGVPCATCLLAAGLILALSFVALWPEGKWRWAPGAVALAGVAALPLWSRILVETERLPGLPEFARSADVRNAPDGAILMVVYEREACSFCKSFRTDYEPRLRGEFGPALFIRRVEASRDRSGLRRLPTFLIRGLSGSTLVIRGLPSYEDLVSKIRNVE